MRPLKPDKTDYPGLLIISAVLVVSVLGVLYMGSKNILGAIAGAALIILFLYSVILSDGG